MNPVITKTESTVYIFEYIGFDPEAQTITVPKIWLRENFQSLEDLVRELRIYMRSEGRNQKEKFDWYVKNPYRGFNSLKPEEFFEFPKYRASVERRMKEEEKISEGNKTIIKISSTKEIEKLNFDEEAKIFFQQGIDSVEEDKKQEVLNKENQEKALFEELKKKYG